MWFSVCKIKCRRAEMLSGSVSTLGTAGWDPAGGRLAYFKKILKYHCLKM